MASVEAEGTDNIVKLLEMIQMMEAYGIPDVGPINEMKAKVRQAVKTTSWTPGQVRAYILFTHRIKIASHDQTGYDIAHELCLILPTVLYKLQSWI